MKLLSLTLLALVLAGSEASPAGESKKEHPGCLVWWFLHGCPLANMFGTDPFKIYPWKKFCVDYPETFSDLGSAKQCEKYRSDPLIEGEEVSVDVEEPQRKLEEEAVKNVLEIIESTPEVVVTNESDDEVYDDVGAVEGKSGEREPKRRVTRGAKEALVKELSDKCIKKFDGKSGELSSLGKRLCEAAGPKVGKSPADKIATFLTKAWKKTKPGESFILKRE